MLVVVSLSGFHYYVLFIDDFSRYSCLCPLSLKSDVYTAFQKSKSLVENQFFTLIKQLQSDGGGEFLSKQFTSFLKSHGIFHRISCPYMAQQNGLAERKHRHVVEMGLSLLTQSGIPQTYWVESFLIVAFLINQLPTPSLQHCSPYFMLFNNLLISLYFDLLVAHVFLFYVLMFLISSCFAAKSVSSWAMACTTSGIDV
jgi:transposase InsO family protein